MTSGESTLKLDHGSLSSARAYTSCTCVEARFNCEKCTTKYCHSQPTTSDDSPLLSPAEVVTVARLIRLSVNASKSTRAVAVWSTVNGAIVPPAGVSHSLYTPMMRAKNGAGSVNMIVNSQCQYQKRSNRP